LHEIVCVKTVISKLPSYSYIKVRNFIISIFQQENPVTSRRVDAFRKTYSYVRPPRQVSNNIAEINFTSYAKIVPATPLPSRYFVRCALLKRRRMTKCVHVFIKWKRKLSRVHSSTQCPIKWLAEWADRTRTHNCYTMSIVRRR